MREEGPSIGSQRICLSCIIRVVSVKAGTLCLLLSAFYSLNHAIQEYAESHGYSIVREYVGHGIGHRMHEPPEVPNYGKPGHGPRLLRGMTIAVEPMVNAGTASIIQMSDGWTVKTADGKNAAHYENTILITDGEPEILTMAEDI